MNILPPTHQAFLARVISEPQIGFERQVRERAARLFRALSGNVPEFQVFASIRQLFAE